MSSQAQSKGSRWYPSEQQVKSPGATQRTLKQVLDQLYSLQDQHNALQTAHTALQKQVAAGGAAGTPQGPADTKLLGLNVEPVDTNTLANGTTLKFNKARGTFSFQ